MAYAIVPQWLMPNPKLLTVTCYGRVYAGTLNMPYLVQLQQDIDVLSANGWLPLGPIAEQLSIGTVVTLPPGSNATAVITGVPPNQVLSLGIPQGAQGSGTIVGLNVGNVVTGAPGSNVAVTLTGNAINPNLNFNIPSGFNGPANNLTIGTVVPGANAAATITGNAPNQVLNLTLPQGVQGNTGAQGAQGNTGAQGAQGNTGVTPAFTVGNVTGVAYNAPAAVSLTGNTTNPILNMNIPAGVPGTYQTSINYLNANYSLTAADDGKVFSANAPVVVTVNANLSPPPNCFFQPTFGASITIHPNGVLIDGANADQVRTNVSDPSGFSVLPTYGVANTYSTTNGTVSFSQILGSPTDCNAMAACFALFALQSNVAALANNNGSTKLSANQTINSNNNLTFQGQMIYTLGKNTDLYVSLSANLNANFSCSFGRMTGNGNLHIVPDTANGVTIYSKNGNLSLTVANTFAQLLNIAQDTYALIGPDLTT